VILKDSTRSRPSICYVLYHNCARTVPKPSGSSTGAVVCAVISSA
jgi:hypothetical protein